MSLKIIGTKEVMKQLEAIQNFPIEEYIKAAVKIDQAKLANKIARKQKETP